jgi:gliding motility-associated-like protein
MKICLLLSITLLLSGSAFAQINISAGGVVNTCNAVFTDDGVGGSYSDTPYTITICPDNPGDVIQANFAAFSLQTSPGNGQSDQLYVYDGMDNTAMPLGPYSGSIANLQITATVNNPTGCLTFVFDPNGPANAGSPGWEALIACTTPCANPTLAAAIVDPMPTGTEQTVSVCMGDDVSFSGMGSAPQPGFTINQYSWDFADGTVGSGMNVTHAFNAPGEFLVNLTVTDNNGCNNVNVIPLQVLVSTVPTFTGMSDLTTCLGDTVYGIVTVGDNVLLDDATNIGGSASGTTWTALPPQVVVGQTYLADGAGFSFSSEIIYDFFEPGQTLNNCDDLWGVMVNMEHSYSGDVSISITCPNGTTVDLVNYPSGGGGIYLGEPIDDFNGADPTVPGTDPGVGYDYEWVTSSTNGTWTDAFNAGVGGGNLVTNVGTPAWNSLAPGQYESTGNLCDLVGCPLNGAWTFSVLDNLGADNGYIFEWGLNLNPALFPGITTFTPTIGAGADSSYWVTTGSDSGIQWIEGISNDGDAIEIFPQALGVYDFTYHVLNSFGCTFDTTIQVTVTQAPFVTAGPDQTVACLPAQLDGGLLNDPIVPCADCGNYTYCYAMNDFYLQTYCPDNAGDGFVSILFSEGSLAVNDNLFVFNGPDTWPSPQLGFYTGDLTGLSWTSTDPSGCLTFYITEWDAVGNCADGGATECVYSVTAGSAEAASFNWEWTPFNPLYLPNTQDPQVLNLPQPSTTFTLTGYPSGYPGCSSSDEVVISLDANSDPGIGGTYEICASDAPFDLFSLLGGTPVTWGEWLLGGVPLANSTFDPATSLPGDYVYFLDSGPTCSTSATLTIDMPLPTTMTIADDTTLCDAGTVNLDLYTLTPGLPPYNYVWQYNGQPVSTLEDFTMNPTESGQACLTVTDACDYVTTQCLQVEVLPLISPAFTADTTAGCWPSEYILSIENDLSEYASSRWLLSDGSSIINQPNTPVSFDAPGVYGVELFLTNSAGCEYSVANNAYLTSYAPPTVGFTVGPQPTTVYDTELQFQSVTTGYPITDYAWTFSNIDGTLLGGSVAANPIFEFPNTSGASYIVNLEVTDIHGCTAMVNNSNSSAESEASAMNPRLVEIYDIPQFYIPSGFTPNGDGLNDVLQFVGADIDETRFQFEVFNRFGEKMFESNEPNAAWTGNTADGDYFAPNGVYSWRAIVVSKSTGVKKEINGSIIIMR